MLTYAGEKVYASEVEGALLSHALVAQAAVVGVPDARLGQYRGLVSLSIED
jgi:non-ribosomal peptide synthetase component E (peptide arylation enzyme)